MSDTTQTLAETLCDGLCHHEGRYRECETKATTLPASPAMATLLAQTRTEALQAAADGIERELICCDAFERRDPRHRHEICYWSGAARQLVLDHVASAREASHG